MRPLLFGPEIRKTIQAVKAAAMDNVINAREAVHMDPETIRNNNSKTTFTIPHGYKITYTVELQPFGSAAHISISVPSPNKGPNSIAVEVILKEFGMLPIEQSAYAWMENIDPTHFAINIIQRLSDVKDMMGLGTSERNDHR